MTVKNNNGLKLSWSRLKSGIRLAWPDERAWRGAAYGIVFVSLSLLAAFALGLAYSSWAAVTVLVITIIGILLGLLGAELSDLVMSLLNGIPATYRRALAGGGLVLGALIYSGGSTRGAVILISAVILSASLLGAGAWSLRGGAWRDSRWSPRARAARAALAAFAAFAGLAALAALAQWYRSPGPAVDPAVNAAALSSAAVEPLEAQNPAQPGRYPVETLTYGSGTDRHRPEYGDQVDLRTPSVDGSPFVHNWQGLSGDLRTRFWGFDDHRLPLNGRVWLPQGQGPFPLALIVHGNHNMMDFSDAGYAYLGELLASRGIILVSVDQNFLNGSWTDLHVFGIDGLREENDARAWLLLEHLDQWRAWNADPGSPFYQKVDMQRLALMGHSRGGEAAAIAAAFNRLPAYPDDATVTFDYNFDLRAVVAIAPPDGQYRPAGRSTPLENVSYFVIQGAYDADSRSFAGLRQYNRATFTGDDGGFKAALYVDRANHSQFNTTWGRTDRSRFPARGLLNRAPILPPEEQRQVAKVYISAFVEAALNGRSEYLPMFRDPRLAREWLPENVYLARYADGGTTLLADYENNLDVTRASRPGVRLSGENLTLWYEQLVRLKRGDQESSAVFLGWDAPAMGETARYRLILGDQAPRPAAGGELVFSLADGNRHPNPRQLGDPGRASGNAPRAGPLDLTVELVDAGGEIARLPLSRFSPVQPQIDFYTLKARFLEDEDTVPGEVVFQSYAFPLAEFQADNPQFDPAGLAEIRFVFDRSPHGVVVLDEIGYQE